MYLSTTYAQIHQTTTALTEILPVKMVGIYLYGSAVDGGLRPQSDLDFFVVVDATVSEEEKPRLVQALLQISGAIGNTAGLRYLEVTLVHQEELDKGTFPIQREFQYGEWLRTDYLTGFIPQKTIDPDLTILLRKVKQNSITLYGKEAMEVIPAVSNEAFIQAIQTNVPQLIQEIEEDQTNVILTLCRMLYSVQTGQILPKDQAATYCLSYLPLPFHTLVEEAKEAYLGTTTPTPTTDSKRLADFGAIMAELIQSV